MKRNKLIILLTLCMAVAFVCACGHVHTFESNYSSNATHHWYASTCEHTDEVSGKEEHTFDSGTVQPSGDVLYACTSCNYVKTVVHEHTFAIEYSSNETHHWFASTCGHSDQEVKETHDFDSGTVQPSGDVLYACTSCGYEKTVVHEHTFASEYSSNETHHWFASTCGHSDQEVKETHEFDNGTVQPSGDVLYICTTCEYEFVEGHEHTFASEYSSNETHHWFASTCGHNVEGSKVQHDFDDGVVQPNGDVFYVCEVCDYEFTHVHVHTFENVYSYDNTHHWYNSTCSHEIIDGKDVHSFDGGQIQPNGDVIYSCSCGYSVTAENGDVTIIGIEVEPVDSSVAYLRTDKIESYIKCRIVYIDGTFGDWTLINSNNVSQYSISGNELTVTVVATISNVAFADTITLTLDENLIGVSELLNSTVDADYTVNGIVAHFATTLDDNEVIIVDKNTGAPISIKGLGSSSVHNGTFYVRDIEIGDEVVLPVKLLRNATSTENANSNKLYAKYVGGNYTELAVVSKNNDISYENPLITIDSSNDLEDFLSSANRADNVYKTVKFASQVNYVMDNSYEIYDFWVYDKDVSAVADLVIDGLTPSFSNASTYLSLGKMFGEIMFDNGYASSIDVNNPETAIKEFTALYIGGNGTHAQFVILSSTAIELTPVITGIDFVQPNKLNYLVGSEIELDGSSLLAHYDICEDRVVEVTNDMLTVPVLDTAGNFEIKGVYEGFEFSFEITVFDSAVKTVELYSMPNKSEYTFRDNFDTIDLTGAQLKVTFENDAIEYVDINKEMILIDESDSWKIGTVNYKVSYLDNTVNLPIEYVNTSLTITQFKAGTIGQTYELTGIVATYVGTNYAELIIKEKNTNNLISIINTGILGSSSSLSFDSSVVNIGDEIIVSAVLSKLTTYGNNGKIYANVGSKEDFISSLLILSSNNDTDFDLTSVPTVSSQSELKTFLGTTETRPFFGIVKLVGVKVAYYTGRYNNIFFGDITSVNNTQHDSMFVVLDRSTTSKHVSSLNNYFSASISTKNVATMTNPATSQYEIYAMFTGGGQGYLNFVILDSSWFVTPSVSE